MQTTIKLSLIFEVHLSKQVCLVGDGPVDLLPYQPVLPPATCK